MPFEIPVPLTPPARSVFVLASVLAAGLMLTVAGCSHVTPLGPYAVPAVPQPYHLRSPLVLRAVDMELPAQPGAGCPSGSVALSGGPGQCYRYTGAPVTVTSAAVSPVSSFQPPTPAGQQAVPAQYGFRITLPAADGAALAVVPTPPASAGGAPVATSAAGGSDFTITVAGRTWVPIGFSAQSSRHQLDVDLASRNQALQLQRTLAAAASKVPPAPAVTAPAAARHER
jgi:hypothetical protein